jgi:hypothetical protein
MHVAWRVDRSLSGHSLPFTIDYFGAPRSHRYESVTYSGFSGSNACRSYLRGKKVDYPTPRSLSRPSVMPYFGLNNSLFTPVTATFMISQLDTWLHV